MASRALIVLCIVLALATASNACGGFSGSCEEWFTTGPYLEASCRTSSGYRIPTAVDLMKCIGVDSEGHLKCGFFPNWTYRGYCDNIKYLPEGTTNVEGVCNGKNGAKVKSTLDLNDCIGNINGHLRCGAECLAMDI